jgi:hypothetical protein
LAAAIEAWSLGTFFDFAPLEHRKISPGSKERADAPTQQMENFMDIVDLKQLMERVLDHSVPPICAIIRRKRTLVTLFPFRRLAHDPRGILAAICQLALMGIELGLHIGFGVIFEDFIGMELRIAEFTDTEGNRSSFYDTQFPLLHGFSLAYLAEMA